MSIDSIVSLVAGKIGELLVQEAKLLYGVDDQVRKLQKELAMMNSYLKDMEALDEEGGDERTRTTIKEIRRIAYDAEDVIETYILEAKPSANKVEYLFKRYFCFCNSLASTHQVGSEIEAIKARIVETMNMWKKYMDENRVRIDARWELRNRSRVGMRPIAYSHTNEEHVVGLDEDIKKLVGVLIDKEHDKIKVVSIVGMGGSGKTTLARKLFNHEVIKNHFDCVAWISVSQQWVTQEILLNLLKNVSGETMQINEPSSFSHQVLVEKLYQYLQMKSYLIVLDDVCEEKALVAILPALPLESDGRKIIVTTRNDNVVGYPNLKALTYTHEPRRLNEKESWKLFEKIALVHREEAGNSMDIAKFKKLGKEMLEKCKGLPFAVIALAGILSQKETLEEWERTKKAVASRIMEDGKGTHLYGPVNNMLALSYIDLPCELKPCFLYLARYPEDHHISVGILIKLWIAEGFITSSKLHEGDTLEDVARRYVEELVHRCLVQVSSRNYDGKVKTFQIHDLVRDLCIKKAKEEDFLEIFTSNFSNSDIIVTESRRAAIFSPDGSYLPFPTKSPHLRSLVYGCGEQTLSLEVIHHNFRLLRVLLLDRVVTSNNTCTLPAGIGSLIHLRFLGLINTFITELPSSIGNLRNLLTLHYNNNTKKFKTMIPFLRIPDVVWKIEGLRHLYLPDTIDVTGMETFKLHTLKYLQTLYLGITGNWMLKELPRLSPSVRKLAITRTRSREQLEAAFQCPSITSDRLHSLELHWGFWSTEGGVDEEKVLKLESLEPIIHSQHLRKLTLMGRMGDGLGSNIQFPTNIKKLDLQCSELHAEATLAALGKLPQLTILELRHGAYMGKKWTCSAGEFSQLKELVIFELQNLEEWCIERGAMPQLRKLQVHVCEKLKKLPEGLKFITTLHEIRTSLCT